MTTQTTFSRNAVILWIQVASDPEKFLTGVRKGVLFQVPAHELTREMNIITLS